MDREGGFGAVEASTFDLRASIGSAWGAGEAKDQRPAWVAELEKSGNSTMLPKQARSSGDMDGFESQLDDIYGGGPTIPANDGNGDAAGDDKFNFARLAAQASGQEDAALRLGTQAWDFSGLSAETASATS